MTTNGVLGLRPLNAPRLVDDVSRSLEEAILAGRLRPGDRLIETTISEELDVSRTTVREALLMLERRGLVVSKPRQGTFVTRLSREEAADLCRARALLEGYAVAVGHVRIDAVFFDRMDELIREMETCHLSEDVPRLIQLDLAIHRLLIELSGSPQLVELWSALNGRIGALILSSFERRHATIEAVAALHRRLLADLRTGDLQTAPRAVIDHYVAPEEDRDGRAVTLEQILAEMARRGAQPSPSPGDERREE